MRVAPHQSEPLGLLRRVLLGLSLIWMTPTSLLAKDDQTKGLPPQVARVLRWLPEDTETLFVARAVTLPEPNPDGLQKLKWQDVGVSLATGGLDLVDGGKYSKPLRGRKIECIVSGARNFDGVSKFGSLRSESCAILVFGDDLGDAAKEWTESLRKGAEEVRTLVGSEVFVFPSTTVMDRYSKATQWQGTYLVLLKPNTVLCASSDRYLETVLRRANEVPESRALPDSLPEWKQIDFDDPVWMLRHVPKVGGKANTVGSTAAFMRNGFRVAYIPKIRSVLNVEQLREEWLPQAQLLSNQLKIVRQPDEAVVLSCGEEFSDNTLWFAWQLYRIQAFELFHVYE